MIDSILSIFSDYIGSFLKGAVNRIRFYSNKLLNRSEPYTKDEALEYAYAVISGNIVQVSSFRNFSTGNIYIAVKAKEKKGEYFFKLILLKKVGSTFIRDWEHELISFTEDFEVIDLQKSGEYFILFIENSFGSGAGTKTLYAFSSSTKKLFKIIEHHDWSDMTRVYTPSIELSPRDVDQKLLKNLEQYASMNDMLKEMRVDFSNPKHAVRNWHRLNGSITEGDVELCFYDGRPTYGSSPTEVVHYDDIEWIGYFKGPLCGYLKKRDEHFIAYSPGWTYDWPQDLKMKGNGIQFTSGKHTLSFELNGNKGNLNNI
ncbi:hypothetical protein A8B79_05950 [Balneola sp. EhC07]|uniref:hypothetical protein n=1 Tax=Balneola sp. EhC07 TaxID=1849360 RepID=UPI0007F5527E|nr:hypothetical protein [Balneola sp. EhC07]OAN61016.1 hypothetical protein A8B79_05950 [Balneola sp. EhC07]